MCTRSYAMNDSDLVEEAKPQNDPLQGLLKSVKAVATVIEHPDDRETFLKKARKLFPLFQLYPRFITASYEDWMKCKKFAMKNQFRGMNLWMVFVSKRKERQEMCERMAELDGFMRKAIVGGLTEALAVESDATSVETELAGF